MTEDPREVSPLSRRRDVGGIPLSRAVVYPLDDGRNLLVSQRDIVLEVVYADVFVDVPGRHLPGDNLLLDRFSPRPDLLISQQ